MTLTIRKIVVLGLIGIIFLMANILVVANWIAETGITEKAGWLRKEFLTGTAVAVTIVLLILLTSPRNSSSGRTMSFTRRCPVCDKRLVGSPNYRGECGSKVQSYAVKILDKLSVSCSNIGWSGSTGPNTGLKRL